MERKWQGWGRGGVGGRRGSVEGTARGMETGGSPCCSVLAAFQGQRRFQSTNKTLVSAKYNISLLCLRRGARGGGPLTCEGPPRAQHGAEIGGCSSCFLPFGPFFFYVPLLAPCRHLSVLCWTEQESASPVPLLVCHVWQTAKMTPTRPLNLKPPFHFLPLFIRLLPDYLPLLRDFIISLCFFSSSFFLPSDTNTELWKWTTAVADGH